MIYHILLYENKIENEKKKYAFKYWKIINAHSKLIEKSQEVSIEIINGEK